MKKELKGPGDPEAEVDVPDAGGVPESVCRAHDPGIVEPGTATEDAIFTLPACPTIPIIRGTIITVIPVILNLFPDIAAHIKEAQPIRPLNANRVQMIARIAPIPGQRIQI